MGGLGEHVEFDLRDNPQGAFTANEKIQHIHVAADEVTGCVLADFRHMDPGQGAGDDAAAAGHD